MSDIQALINRFGIIGAAAGSLFVFKRVYKALLVNFPSRDEKEELYSAVASTGPDCVDDR